MEPKIDIRQDGRDERKQSRLATCIHTHLSLPQTKLAFRLTREPITSQQITLKHQQQQQLCKHKLHKQTALTSNLPA